ncbi:MAG: hypothetical protein HYT62_03435 [Candidatus Yanofskybacteria bacterium]|nr:hypothetical protein [Candidatus Yanofskybacteria bacterium]
MSRNFTGEELAKAHLLHLTTEELGKYFDSGQAKKTRVISDGYFSRLWRRIKPEKIFLIRFDDGHGVIIMADSENDACIEAVPFLAHGRRHSCRNPLFNGSCKDCREFFDNLATRLNQAKVTWLGWGQPDYNWVIHV